MLRQARVTDVPDIHALINHFADKGEMLPRTRARLYETVRDFVVREEDSKIVGAGALRTVWEELGEICSLAVREDHQHRGIGTDIVESLLSQAIIIGLKKVFVLTYIPGFFKRFGMRGVPKNRLPHKVWADCVNCPKFPDCDEKALVKEL